MWLLREDIRSRHRPSRDTLIRERGQSWRLLHLGTRKKQKDERVRKALLDPQRSAARLWPGANTHNRSPTEQLGLRLSFRCSVLSTQHSAKNSLHLVHHCCWFLSGVAEGLDLTYTTTSDIYALTPPPLLSLFLAIHLLGIAPEDGVDAFLLNAELSQRLFYKFKPVPNGGFCGGLGGR